MALASLAIALFVGFLPLTIEKLRARRSARPIPIVSSPGTSTTATSGQACRRADSTAAGFIAETRQMAASADSAWSSTRSELEIPQVDSAAVSLVIDDAICRNVLAAFNTTLPASWPARPPTSAYVAKVGNVYIAMVPAPPDGSVRVYTVIDARYDVLSKYAK